MSEVETIEALGAISLPDHEGNLVQLRALWRETPVAFVFLRHYG